MLPQNVSQYLKIPRSKANRTIRQTTFLLLVVLLAIAANCQAQSLGLGKGRTSDSGSYGSVAVAVIRQDTIIVAAESRTTTEGRINPDTTCKITIVDNIVFAATGLLKGNQNALGIVDYARSVLHSNSKTRYKLDTFQSGASRLLTSWMNVPEERDSLLESSTYRYLHSIRTMFCFFSRGEPVVVEYLFTPSLDRGRFKIGGVYDAGVRKPGEILWVGAFEETAELLKKDSAFADRIHGLDAASAAQSLIQRQMGYTPRIVGGDIDIVLITPEGAKWLRRKQNCY